MTETVRVNFGSALPLFPLPDTVLLPHAVLPLHIFERRYREMVSTTLDRTGQIALATFAARREKTPSGRAVKVRSVACIGQIIQHEALPDGRYNILLHGICRARIKKLIEPEDDRPYRMAELAPIEPLDAAPSPMPHVRDSLRKLLTGPCLRRLRGIDTLMEWIDREDVPTHALLELIGSRLVRDTELKYSLLAEPDPQQRRLITGELRYLHEMIRHAEVINHLTWPTGVSWN